MMKLRLLWLVEGLIWLHISLVHHAFFTTFFLPNPFNVIRACSSHFAIVIIIIATTAIITDTSVTSVTRHSSAINIVVINGSQNPSSSSAQKLSSSSSSYHRVRLTIIAVVLSIIVPITLRPLSSHHHPSPFLTGSTRDGGSTN